MSFPQDSTVVLAHGAWADASIWSKVIFPLRSQGLNVMVVQLPLTTLQDDVAVLQRSLARISGATVLVGHFYTGAVITEAATGNDLIKALVYVSAMAPEQGAIATPKVLMFVHSSSKPKTGRPCLMRSPVNMSL